MKLDWYCADGFSVHKQMDGHAEYRTRSGEYAVYREPAPGAKRRSWYRPYYLPNGNESQSEHLGLEDSLRRAKASCRRHSKREAVPCK